MEIHGLADLLSEDTLGVLRTVGRYTKVTNMHLERLLALVRAVVPYSQRKVSAERAAYASHLSALTGEFKSRGGKDYRNPQVRVNEGPLITRSKATQEAVNAA